MSAENPCKVRKDCVANLVILFLDGVTAAHFRAHELTIGSKNLDTTLHLIHHLAKLYQEDAAGPIEIVEELMHLVGTMHRAQQHLAECGDYILNNSPPDRVPPALVGLAHLSQQLATLILKTCVQNKGILQALSSLKDPNGFLYQLASCLRLGATCAALIRQALAAPLFRPTADPKTTVYALSAMLKLAEAQMIFYGPETRRENSSGAPQQVFEQLAPLESEYILGHEAAITTLQFYLEHKKLASHQSGYENLGQDIICSFLRVSGAVFASAPFNARAMPDRYFLSTFLRLGIQGVATFVDYFCKTANALINDLSDPKTKLSDIFSTASRDGGVPGPAPGASLCATLPFWLRLIELHQKEEALNFSLRPSLQYLSGKKEQIKMLEATTRLHAHLTIASTKETASENTIRNGILKIQTTVLISQAACYSASLLQPLEAVLIPGSTTIVPGSTTLTTIEMARWLAPGSKAMATLVRAVRDGISTQKRSNYSEIWDILHIASIVFFQRSYELLETAAATHELLETAAATHELLETAAATPSNCNPPSVPVPVPLPVQDFLPGDLSQEESSALRYTRADISVIHNCFKEIIYLDIAQGELLAAFPQAWKSFGAGGGVKFSGPIPFLPQLAASSMLASTESSVLDSKSDYGSVLGAVDALDTAVKCQLTYSKLELPSYEIIKRACSSLTGTAFFPSNDSYFWARFAGGTLFTVLPTIFGTLAQGPSEFHGDGGPGPAGRVKSIKRATTLAMLRSCSNFEVSIGPEIDVSYYIGVASALFMEIEEGAEKETVLLPEDLPALEVLHRHLLGNSTDALPKAHALGSLIDNDSDGIGVGPDKAKQGAVKGLRECMVAVVGAVISSTKKQLLEVNELVERRIRRSKVLIMRPCCNLGCANVTRDGVLVPRRICTICRQQYYCSPECQKAAYDEHQAVCGALKDENKSQCLVKLV